MNKSKQTTVMFVKFEVFTVVPMKEVIFIKVMPCGSFKNRHCGGTYHLHHQGDMNRKTICAFSHSILHSMLRLLVTANIVPSSQILCHPDDGGDKFLQ
jgi:hypothetical protein